MNRDELTALRDAIDTVLTWPDAVRDQVARWLAPEAAKPNGRDPHPPPTPTSFDSKEVSTRRSLAPYAGKARRGKPPPHQAKVRQSTPFNTKTVELKLLEALAERPGVSVAALAKAAGASRSRAGERLRGLASRGVVTKDSAGHWRLMADLAGEAARPTEASPS